MSSELARTVQEMRVVLTDENAPAPLAGAVVGGLAGLGGVALESLRFEHDAPPPTLPAGLNQGHAGPGRIGMKGIAPPLPEHEGRPYLEAGTMVASVLAGVLVATVIAARWRLLRGGGDQTPAAAPEGAE